MPGKKCPYKERTDDVDDEMKRVFKSTYTLVYTRIICIPKLNPNKGQSVK